MNTELDSLTIKAFESRYGVARSNIYNRINGLKEKGYAMEPEKQRGKSVFNADQIRVMDALDQLLQKPGGTIADFPSAEGVLSVSQDNLHLSHRTQDTRHPVSAGTVSFGMVSVIDAIASKVATIVAHQSSPDPLANLRTLQEACDRGWELRTSQLAPLLGLKSLHGTEIKRHGFTFTKVGKIGAESAWKVTKG